MLMAALCRRLGDMALAEDVLQDAYASAAAAWAEGGVPDRPGAWLWTAAKRRAIDIGRRERRRGEAALEHEPEAPVEDEDGDEAIPDRRLALVFVCCHPALSVEAQVALTLRAVGGLATEQIARAFLVPVATMAQRLVRAQRKVREAEIPMRTPPPELWDARLDGVLGVLYLIFNEGYSPAGGERVVDHPLCAEAIRLGALLAELLPREREVHGLLALMLFHHARRATRETPEGRVVTLEKQDRSRWDAGMIRAAIEAVGAGSATGDGGQPPGAYTIQAWIAAEHCLATSYERTRWDRIVALYDMLVASVPGPVVRLNRAAAVAMVDGPAAGLAAAEVANEGGALDRYPYLHTLRADLLSRLGRVDEARGALRAALGCVEDGPQRREIEARLAGM